MLHRNLFEGHTLELTDTAKEILEESKGKDFIESNLQRLCDKVNNHEITSPLDIQNSSASIIINESDSEEFKPIKDYIVNDIKYSDEILNFNTVIFIMAIYLRDKYFELNPRLKEVFRVNS